MNNIAEKSVRLKIGFAWQTLTSENLGVGALAQSQLAIARLAAKKAEVEIDCMEFCPTGPNSDLATKLNCQIADPLSPKKILFGKSSYIKQMNACDAVLDIGAGDSFSDIYGGKHFFFLSLSKIIALFLKKPLVLSPQTIGPFKKRWVRFLSSAILKRSSRVFARDGLSMDFLNTNSSCKNSEEVIDVAFRLPFEYYDFQPSGVIRVGINVSGLLFNGGYTGNNQFGLTVNYVELVRNLIASFLALPNVEVHLVPHVLSETMPVEDDFAVLAKLKLEFPSTVLAPRFSVPSEAKGYISGLDFFTGARMHACIGAFSAGVPVVPMAYSRKFNGLFNSLGYSHIADLIKDTTEVALEKVLQGFHSRTELKQQIEEGNASAQKKIQRYEDYLVGLFTSLKSKKMASI